MSIEKRMRRGFISGVALSLLVAVSIFSAVHMTNAQADDAGLLGGDSSSVASMNTSTTSSSQPLTKPDDSSADDNATVASYRYVALGDSVAAGLGLPLVTDASRQDQTCGRSSQSYAYEVGRQLGYTTTLLACSGDTAGDLITRQGIAGPNPAAQVSAAFADGQPDVISITSGANDAQWQRFIQKCYAGTCGTRTDSTVASGALVVLQAKLHAALASIKARSQGTPPTVVLTGYYNPVSANCSALQSRVTTAEITWLNASVAALNKTIQDMATITYSSFVRYAPVDFSGHDLCASQPWIQGLTDAAPVHPTASGQRAIAGSVVQALQ